MNLQDFIQKAEQGSLTDVEMKDFLTNTSAQLVDLKEKDPAAYLKAITALNDAAMAITEGLAAAK